MFKQTIKDNFINSSISMTKKSLQILFVGLLLQVGFSAADTGDFRQINIPKKAPKDGTTQFKVATRSLPISCGVEATLPYVVIFVGTPGYLTAANQGIYYRGAAKRIADALDSKCVRTIIIETTQPYRGSHQMGSVDTGAAYIYKILVTLQANIHLKNASKWYLMGGSAGALMSVKLLDNNFRSPGGATILDLPAGVILESLPSSGNVATDCEHTNTNKTEPSNKPSGYEQSVDRRRQSCSYVNEHPETFRNNPRYEFLDGKGIKNYMDEGKKVFIMQGANDPLFKENNSGVDTNVSNEPGWTMTGLLKNFVSNTQLEPTCTRTDGIDSPSDDLIISNTQKTWLCYSGRLFARTYKDSGHSPIRINDNAVNDLIFIIDTTH